VSSFLEAFLKGRPEDRAAHATLRAELESVRARARAAWPDIDVPEERFAEVLAARVPKTADPAAALRALHAEDLYLVTACVLGNNVALGAIQSAFVPGIRAALLHKGFTEDVTSETLQVVLQEVFVGSQTAPPKALTYNGQGALRGWLRVVAVRTGLRLVRKSHPGERRDERASEASLPDPHDLELDYLKRTYAETFREAFREAFEQLATEDRVLLRQRITHGLSIEQLGQLHGVHASTISRRVTTAREVLVGATREGMMRRLRLGRAEAASIMRLIQSQLDITISSTQAVSTEQA
jgi:RNA polymerase sigma-70 factor, ECF subfamily